MGMMYRKDIVLIFYLLEYQDSCIMVVRTEY